MIPPRYQHQQKIVDDDPKKCLIAWGTGCSKTRSALELARGKTLVLCPKQQRDDETWQRNAEKFGIKIDLTVLSKEDLKKDWETLPRFDTVIFDECENFFGVQPETRQRKGVQIPKTSQVFEATYNFLKKNPPERLYFCSATPVGKPMNLWAIATLMGQKWDYFDFRRKYYADVRIVGRRIWLPRKDEATKTCIAEIIRKMGYVGSLQDFFDVPDQTHKTVYVELTEEQKVAMRTIVGMEADPLVRKARERTVENGVYYGKKIGHVSGKVEEMVNETKIFPSKKIDYILERAIEFPKMLIFANYTAQIYEIEKALKKEGYPVVTLTGATKDRKSLISDADKSDACIVIAQASICSGYELPSFPCVIFASKNWQYRFYEQALGRVQRSNAIKKNLYIHLVVKGGSDERCHNTILSGADFQEKLSLE